VAFLQLKITIGLRQGNPVMLAILGPTPPPCWPRRPRCADWPATATGTIFLTLEDESGYVNVVVLASPVIIGPLAVLGFLDQGETHERQEI
jgi:hypothetical protein